MKLITVEATFPADIRDKAISIFSAKADAVRAMEGCVSYAIYAHAANETDIVIVQRWNDQHQFDLYRASETFKELGGDLKPIMSTPPVTTLCQIEA